MQQIVQVTLNPHAVVQPIVRSVIESIELVSICLPTVEQADVEKAVEVAGSRMGLTFRGTGRTPEGQRASYVNWILSKGFQEYARGIRQALESAHVHNRVMALARETEEKTWGALREVVDQARRWADKATFPALMAEVNRNLSAPLNFEKEFLSLQKVRNCLEHRNGVVTKDKIDPVTGILTLSFPRPMLFYERDGKEVEVGAGSYIDPGGEGKSVIIKMRFVAEERKLVLGEKVTFKPEEFYDIGWGCWAFAQELAQKLPKHVGSAAGG